MAKDFAHFYSLRTDIEENHAQQDERQVESLGLEVLLVEEGSTEEETDHHTAATHHRDDANHGIGQRQGVEIEEVGGGEEDTDADDGPMPVKGRGAMVSGPPQQHEHGKHHEALVDVVP